jgi:DNA-binding XRE family transcriptional regulator
MNEAFKTARENAGFSKNGLFKQTGINRGTIHRIEINNHTPELKTAVILADKLNVTSFDEFKKIFLPGYSHDVSENH